MNPMIKHISFVAVLALMCTAFASPLIHQARAQSGTWTSQREVTGVFLYAIKAVNQNVGWAAGEGGTVLRTVNGGISWESVGDTSIGIGWSIDAIDSSFAWLATSATDAGGDVSIYRTTNGGGKWQQVYSLISGGVFLNCLKMHDASTGFAIGDPIEGKWLVLKTTDGGDSWAHLPTAPEKIGDPVGFLNTLALISLTDIRFVTGGDTSRIYRSTDAGVTWAMNRIPLPANSYTQALKFNSPLIGVVGSSTKTLARTTDGGETWTSFTLPGPGTWGLSGYDTTFVAANWHAVQKSTDNGQSWIPAWSTDIGQLLNADFVKSQGYVRGWVLGATIKNSVQYANIATYYEAITAVPGGEPGRLPMAVQLHQNFPNPFNPTTVVKYQLPVASEVKLVVFDMLGRAVSTLVNERKDAGYHEVQFNGRGLASGVYLYRMTAGHYVDTKKLVLLR